MLSGIRAALKHQRERRRRESSTEARETGQECVCGAGGKGPVSRGQPLRASQRGERSGGWSQRATGNAVQVQPRERFERVLLGQDREVRWSLSTSSKVQGGKVGQTAAGGQRCAHSQGSQESSTCEFCSFFASGFLLAWKLAQSACRQPQWGSMVLVGVGVPPRGNSQPVGNEGGWINVPTSHSSEGHF